MCLPLACALHGPGKWLTAVLLLHTPALQLEGTSEGTIATYKIIIAQLYALAVRPVLSLADVAQVLPTLRKASGCRHILSLSATPDMSLHGCASAD